MGTSKGEGGSHAGGRALRDNGKCCRCMGRTIRVVMVPGGGRWLRYGESGKNCRSKLRAAAEPPPRDEKGDPR